MEENLSHQESLRLISEMINRAKNTYYTSGFCSLLWGFANLVCFTLAYLIETRRISLPLNPFWLMIPVFIVHVIYSRKEDERRKSKSYYKEVQDYVWTSFSICIVIVTIIGGIAGMGYWVLPVLLLFFGFLSYVSGRILRHPMVITGSLICWVLSIIAFLISKNNYWQYNFLLVAAGATAAWIIPGFALRKRFKKMKKESNV